MTSIEIGDMLYTYRVQHNIPLKNMSKMLGIRITTLYDYERGISSISRAQLKRIVEFLGISHYEFPLEKISWWDVIIEGEYKSKILPVAASPRTSLEEIFSLVKEKCIGNSFCAEKYYGENVKVYIDISSHRKSSLCWNCQKAAGVGGWCSWSAKLKPVEGWEAIQRQVNNTDSYIVINCPEFVPDRSNYRDMLKVAKKCESSNDECEEYKLYFRYFMNAHGKPCSRFKLKKVKLPPQISLSGSQSTQLEVNPVIRDFCRFEISDLDKCDY